MFCTKSSTEQREIAFFIELHFTGHVYFGACGWPAIRPKISFTEFNFHFQRLFSEFPAINRTEFIIFHGLVVIHVCMCMFRTIRRYKAIRESTDQQTSKYLLELVCQTVSLINLFQFFHFDIFILRKFILFN